MGKPKLLDLCCGAGGCSAGYAAAGFDVTGIDNIDQADYPYRFIKADALQYLADHGAEYDAIHGSFPCKVFTGSMNIRVHDKKAVAAANGHKDLITPARPILEALGRPYVLENVVGARTALRDPILLCGAMFGLKVIRHRLFETSFYCIAPDHVPHKGTVTNGEYMTIAGMGGPMWADKEKTVRRKGSRKTADWRDALDMPWVACTLKGRYALTQAIPPIYTRYIGAQLMAHLSGFHDDSAISAETIAAAQRGIDRALRDLGISREVSAGTAGEFIK